MHRFFVSPELVKITSIEVPLPKDLAHQIRDVIRLDIGEKLLLLDNSGDEVLATVARINKASVEVYLLERRPGKKEPAVRIILCQGMLKSTRFEWILEKGTELGVSVFSPIICRRSIAGLEGTGSSKIAALAANHSGSRQSNLVARVSQNSYRFVRLWMLSVTSRRTPLQSCRGKKNIP